MRRVVDDFDDIGARNGPVIVARVHVYKRFLGRAHEKLVTSTRRSAIDVQQFVGSRPKCGQRSQCCACAGCIRARASGRMRARSMCPATASSSQRSAAAVITGFDPATGLARALARGDGDEDAECGEGTSTL